MATTKKDDLGAAEVQERIDAINEKGFVGSRVDPHDDHEHSIQSGPDAPPAVPDAGTRFAQADTPKEA